jgi:hypothetical protein
MRPVRPLLAAACALAVAVTAGLAPAQASAATVSTTIPCVANLGFAGALTLPLAGSGFTPNASVAIVTTTPADAKPSTLTTVKTDAAGNLRTRVDPPALHSATTVNQVFGLTAVDVTNPSVRAATSFRQVRFGFDVTPATGRPARTVTYTARGFLPGKPVYAHFRFKGVTRRDVLIGTASAPCGVVAKKLRLLPTKTRFGTWTVYMDQVPVYSKKTILQAKGSLVIHRTL